MSNRTQCPFAIHHPRNRRLWRLILLISASLSIPWTLACGAAAQGTNTSTTTSNVAGLRISGVLPTATANKSYAAVLSVSGGQAPYAFSVEGGNLPEGLHLNPATGSLSGVPSSSGIYPFSIRVTDASKQSNGTAPYELAVLPGKGAFGGVSIAVQPETATVNASAKQQFSATVTGSANTAVTWSASVGTIAGGAFVAPAVTASTSVTITATSVADSTKSASAIVTVLPVAKPQQLAIQTSSISSAEAGQPYRASLSATGGQTPYKWTIGGNLPKGVSLSSAGVLSGSTSSTGNFNFTATVTDSASNSAHQALTLTVSSTSGNFDGPAELPRVQMKWTLADTPAPGKTISVNAGGSLVSALASANCGDTIELQAGATFDGSVNMPAKPCDDQHWIVIRTSAPDSALPAEGQRLNPCYAGVASLPNRPAYSCPKVQNVLARLIFSQNAGSGPILFAGGANHYRFIGLEITRPLKTGSIVALISSLPEAAVDHIVIDRCWIHGTAQDETRRGININGITYGAIVDSYINDFHCVALTGGCVDSQAIGGGSGDIPTGPLQIQDNFLEAASENILFGGGNATIVPQDITIHGNHFYKPPQWMKGTKNFVGGPTGNPFIVKNHIELKNASRLLIENNIFEYTWGGFSQSGFSVMITPRNNYDQITKQGNGCAVCETTDLTFRYNIFRHVGAGIAIANPLTANEMAAAGGRDSIHDDVLEDIDAQTYNGSGSLFMVFNSWNKNVLNSISIRHVTGFPDVVHGTVMSVSNSLDYPTMFGFTFEDNLIVSSKYPIWSAGAFGSRNCAISDVPVTVVNTCFQNWTFTNNVIAAVWASFLSPKWPANNMFPATVDDVGFADFNNGNGGNYQLLSSSPYKNKASDGTDPGADISALEAAIQAVE